MSQETGFSQIFFFFFFAALFKGILNFELSEESGHREKMQYLLTPRLNVRCSPCPKVALHHCHIHFDPWEGLPYAMHFYFEPSKPLTATSFFIHCNHVFLGWPLGLLPVTIVLSTFLGHVSGSIR